MQKSREIPRYSLSKACYPPPNPPTALPTLSPHKRLNSMASHFSEHTRSYVQIPTVVTEVALHVVSTHLFHLIYCYSNSCSFCSSYISFGPVLWQCLTHSYLTVLQ